MTVPVLMATIFLSCKKSDNYAFNKEIENEVTVKNGIATFKSIAGYLKIAANKNGEQQILFDKLTSAKFNALIGRSVTPVNTSNQRVEVITPSINPVFTPIVFTPVITLSFDRTLYTDYLLNILNFDKICQIGNYLVKVDLDNGFCSVIDAGLHPNETGDLTNNVFANTNIMTFVNEDEPVMDVLTNICNNTLTWSQYEVLRASKGGPGGPGGFCFAKGSRGLSHNRPRSVAGGVITSIARYSKNFIHFELVAEGYANGNGWNEIVSLRGKYEYVGACKGSYAAVIYAPGLWWKTNLTLYSGGSALAIAKLEITATSSYHGVGWPASIGY